MVQVSPEAYRNIAEQEIFRRSNAWKPTRCDKTVREFWSSHFWSSPEEASWIWNRLDEKNHLPVGGAQPKHLLWAFILLKIYAPSQKVHCTLAGGPDEKTFVKWSWLLVRAMVDSLFEEVIVWENRFRNWDGKTVGLTTCDGKDCPVHDQWPFDRTLHSQKLNGPAYRYLVAIAITDGSIVGVFGPRKAGANPDLKIFREEMAPLMCSNEITETDNGFGSDLKTKKKLQALSHKWRVQKNVLGGRQENVHSIFDEFNVLSSVFHHSKPKDEMMEKHGYCFKACAIMIQKALDLNRRYMYLVDYDVQYP
jgi:hypothetical protein